MISEKKWMIVRVAGPNRQHVSAGAPRSTRRDAWQACLDEYVRVLRRGSLMLGRVAPDAGYDLFHEQVREGKLKAVKVTISWENVR